MVITRDHFKQKLLKTNTPKAWQSMNEEYANNSKRLTIILYHLYSGEKTAPSDTLPFSLDKDGTAILSDDLMTALSRAENADLIAWAKEHISELVFR
jgi:hypothetical protein